MTELDGAYLTGYSLNFKTSSLSIFTSDKQTFDLVEFSYAAVKKTYAVFFPHTFPLHAHGQALLIAAVLAAIALAFVNQALLVVPASVAQVFADSSFEETFAALTAVDSIVLACKGHKVNKSRKLMRVVEFRVVFCVLRTLTEIYSVKILQKHMHSQLTAGHSTLEIHQAIKEVFN